MSKEFTTWLEQKKGITPKTAKYKKTITSQYLQWLAENELTLKKASYKTLLHYIGHLQSQNFDKNTINNRLKTISDYHEYLGIKDIAKGVQLRGVTKKHQLFLSEEELKILYEAFESYNSKGHYIYCDKLILGLMIYQALDERDIYGLEINHINLEKGTLYIPSNPRSKESRTLALEAHQILAFKTYIDHYRKPYHKEHKNQESDKLFSPNCDKPHRLHDQTKLMSKALKQTAFKTNINIHKLYTLRQSRISIWIKQHGLRKAQYMAGYRSVASVELYKINDISDLQEQIKLLHPLNRQ